MEIRCDTVLGKCDKDYIPSDGTILPETVFEIEEGDTVYDVLTEAAQTYGIQIAQDYYSSTYGDKGYLFLEVDVILSFFDN